MSGNLIGLPAFFLTSVWISDRKRPILSGMLRFRMAELRSVVDLYGYERKSVLTDFPLFLTIHLAPSKVARYVEYGRVSYG